MDTKNELRGADSLKVDFSYSPPEWQTAICLPDDRQKSLVDKSGELLYHYGLGSREFGTRIAVEVTGNAVWQDQQLYSPRIPIVITYRKASEVKITEEAFAVTDLTKIAGPPKADTSSAEGPSRNDIILVHVTNTGKIPRLFHPRLIVDTRMELHRAGQKIIVNKHNTICSSLKIIDSSDTGQFQLDSIAVPAGKTRAFFVLYSSGEPIINEPATLEEAYACRDQAVNYWESINLPYGRIEVPDPGIQSLIDSAIRNIWQAREIKKGLPAFQVGPTCYRGLWIVDGAFLLEAATILGAGQEARNGVAYELTFQQADGRIQVMKNYSKENGIVLWTCVRHARLTQDKDWLASVWPNLEKIARYIRDLRMQTRTNESPLDDGLVPAGFPDGGIGGIHDEYTNTYWNLVGLHTFIRAARWLGHYEQAAEWQQEYDNFMHAFRVAALRDSRFDQYGNRYLPTLMDGEDLPQRGQWAFCHAVYPGQIFDRNDPLVKGNLAMLAATEREGMVYGTGWDATGIWNYFASFYAHALLWQGDGYKAAKTLYAFANHASPLLAWREEQSLKGADFRKVGDMPHNWASAEFIRLAVHLLALDRGSELHLFEGLPAAWTRPGMITRLTNISTPFGHLRFELAIDAEGRNASLDIAPLYDNGCRKIIVHLGGWASGDASAVRELNPGEEHHLKIPLNVLSFPD
jgi:hypothetical protein